MGWVFTLLYPAEAAPLCSQNRRTYVFRLMLQATLCFISWREMTIAISMADSDSICFQALTCWQSVLSLPRVLVDCWTCMAWVLQPTLCPGYPRQSSGPGYSGVSRPSSFVYREVPMLMHGCHPAWLIKATLAIFLSPNRFP